MFADYKLNGNFFAGALARTAPAADSGNTTVSGDFDNHALCIAFQVG